VALLGVSIGWLMGPVAATAVPPGGQGSGGGQTTFSGQATVVQATILGNEIMVADTGPLPPTGGAQQASLLEAEVPGLLTAEVAHAAVVAQRKASHAEASVANVSLSVASHSIFAGFLMARATAECHGNSASVSGSSEIAALVVDGQAIVVSGQPNQTITLVDMLGVEVGRVVINEQESSVSGGTGDITVNALHVEVFGVADIVIAHAHADINCAGIGPPGDFVTGGGWITGTPSGILANFGVAGGIRNGAFWGHLTYIDHGSGTKVKGTGVTAYMIVNATTRHIEGTAEVNHQGGFTYQVDVSDNGEPGVNDVFTITVSNGYMASGALVGGNIQLHD
jgi:hypothetical protein